MIKKVTLLLSLLLINFTVLEAQNKFTGNWMGKISVQGTSLRIVFKISEDEKGSLKAHMGSPDQTSKEFPVDSIFSSADTIRLFVKAIRGTFSGVYKNDTLISGTLYQGAMHFPCDLSRSDLSTLNDRPQNPKKPYPYKEEEITFNNKSAGITLGGTFTYPEKGSKFPAVILITGSGWQDRDETVFRHKPFLVLSDYLTRNGFAVLRFDDRGGGKSTGNYSTSTSLDFSTDVMAALDYLKSRSEVDVNKIGLIGHSEGGIIAQIVASHTNDVAFVVFMAGPGTKGADLLLKQTKMIMEAAGMDSSRIAKAYSVNKQSYDIAVTEKDSAKAYKKLSSLMDKYYNESPDSEKTDPQNSKEALMQGVKVLLSPWVRYFLAFNPADYLAHIKIPVLAINGELDTQVPADDNLAAIDKYLKKAKNKNYKTIKFPGLNHLFQHCKTGSPNEYISIEETISPEVLQTINNWLKEQVKR